MTIHLGITGTRIGMNEEQKSKLITVIETLLFNKEHHERVFHHGQCIGVDVEAAVLLKNKFGFTIVSHPPIKKELIGVCENDSVKPAKDYFARNRDIVNSCDLLLVIPRENTHQKYGGTWYTHDYALKQKKPIILLTPNGVIGIKNK